MGITKKNAPDANGREDIPILFGAIFIFITVYFIYRFIKNTPSIILNDNSIAFGNAQYLTTDIDTIEYTGKHAFKGWNIKQEGMKISFRNGESLCIFDNLYSNGHIMKQHIQFMLNPEEKCFRPIKINRVESETFGTFVTYRGLLLLNFAY
ncbi:hypothetical protein OGH69_14905 [Flavobacterium sp. MFBS3-15]|uniref:hypothetical protein n=1 Tax=Flavobacterium sp. MFBS3-15 TaxID=2989816 RepID=UPI002235FC90|nr:hypothetical protein [Flavobacterium sp. MFBS3-15]MCW4470263.1 hypothetical protein [Flavobacterium sp. MFBS3-15]